MEQLSVLFHKEASLLQACRSPQIYGLQKHVINYTPWPSYTYRPKVSFSIAYDDHNIFLTYYVTEKFLRAAVQNINGPFYEDTCVEFFISFDELGYYNLEFSYLIVARVGFGKDKKAVP